jgi:hypothetical protein
MAINDVFISSIIIWQAKPYVFNAFVFQNLLVQTFFETYGICMNMTTAETLSKKFPNKTKIYSDLTRLFFFLWCNSVKLGQLLWNKLFPLFEFLFISEITD